MLSKMQFFRIIILGFLVFPLSGFSSSLIDMINNDDVWGLNTYIQENPGLELQVTINDITLSTLNYAFLNNRHRAINTLIEHRMGINTINSYYGQDICPLEQALDGGNIPALFLLLSQQPDLSLVLDRGYDRKDILYFQLSGLSTLSRKELDHIMPPLFREQKQQLLDIIKGDNAGTLRSFLQKYPWWKEHHFYTEEVRQSGSDYLDLEEMLVRQGAIKCLKALPAPDAYTLARTAIEYGHIDILKYLMPNVSPTYHSFVLQSALISKNTEAIKTVLKYIPDISRIFLFNGASVFDYSYTTLDPGIVKLIMQAYNSKAPVKKAYEWIEKGELKKIKDTINSNNIAQYSLAPDCSLVHWAAFLGQTDILHYLLTIGADPGWTQSYLGSQPIYLAALMRQRHCFRLLTEAHASLSLYYPTMIEKEEPFSLVEYCYQNLGREETIALLKNDVDFDMELIGYGVYSHLLIMAIKVDDREMVEFLLDEYEPEYARCVIALEYAIKYDRPQYFDTWIKYGYDFNHYNELVEYAVRYDKPEIYRYLIKLNKKYSTKNDLRLVLEHDALNILKSLAIPKPNLIKAPNLTTALGYGSSRCAEYLLGQGADPNAKDSKGQTPLYLYRDNLPMVQLLLGYHADPLQTLKADPDNLVYRPYSYGLEENEAPAKYTVLDYTKDYTVFSLLRQAGARYAWEMTK